MAFADFIRTNQVNDILRATRAQNPVRMTVDNLLEAHEDYCLTGMRLPLYEAWKRRTLPADRDTERLRCLRTVFGPGVIPYNATRVGIADTQLPPTGLKALGDCNRFDTEAWRIMSVNAIRQLDDEDRIPVAKFSTTMMEFTDVLWANAQPNGTTITSRQARHFMRRLKALIADFGIDRVYNTFNTNYTKAAETETYANACIALLPDNPITIFDTWRTSNQTQWNRVEGCLDFWETELPRFKERAGEVRQILARHAMGGSFTDRVKRFISQGEIDALTTHRGFRQYAQKLEREKWFFTSDGSPGQGVQHDFIMTAHLRAGTVAFLQGLGVQRDAYNALDHVVYLKQNEGGCFGIHEDALGAFNCLVEKVVITRRTSPNVTLHTITFNGWNAGTLDALMVNLRAAITTMLA